MLSSLLIHDAPLCPLFNCILAKVKWLLGIMHTYFNYIHSYVFETKGCLVVNKEIECKKAKEDVFKSGGGVDGVKTVLSGS